MRYIVIACIYFVVLNVFSLSFPAYSLENTYYSIHIASFKELLNANRYVNELEKKGKLVFWKKTDIPGKGEWHRVYLGKYQDREKAVEFWYKLSAEGKVSYFGVHSFTEEIPQIDTEKPPGVIGDKTPEIKKSPVVEDNKLRFVDNRDGTISDKKTKLMWIKNGWRIDFFSALKWEDAVKKCENFRHAGFSDWRLPTIKEWKTLLDKKNEYPAMVEPNPFENVIVHMPYWSRSKYQYINSKKSLNHPTHIYTVMLYYGRVGHQNVNQRAFILPVRDIK